MRSKKGLRQELLKENEDNVSKTPEKQRIRSVADSPSNHSMHTPQNGSFGYGSQGNRFYPFSPESQSDRWTVEFNDSTESDDENEPGLLEALIKQAKEDLRKIPGYRTPNKLIRKDDVLHTDTPRHRPFNEKRKLPEISGFIGGTFYATGASQDRKKPGVKRRTSKKLKFGENTLSNNNTNIHEKLPSIKKPNKSIIVLITIDDNKKILNKGSKVKKSQISTMGYVSPNDLEIKSIVNATQEALGSGPDDTEQMFHEYLHLFAKEFRRFPKMKSFTDGFDPKKPQNPQNLTLGARSKNSRHKIAEARVKAIAKKISKIGKENIPDNGQCKPLVTGDNKHDKQVAKILSTMKANQVLVAVSTEQVTVKDGTKTRVTQIGKSLVYDVYICGASIRDEYDLLNDATDTQRLPAVAKEVDAAIMKGFYRVQLHGKKPIISEASEHQAMDIDDNDCEIPEFIR